MTPVIEITSQVFDLEELLFFKKTNQTNQKPTNKKSKRSDVVN